MGGDYENFRENWPRYNGYLYVDGYAVAVAAAVHDEEEVEEDDNDSGGCGCGGGGGGGCAVVGGDDNYHWKPSQIGNYSLAHRRYQYQCKS